MEEIQTEATKNGKRTFAVFNMGERVDTFKKLVEKEEDNLKEYWRQWGEIQDEYLELGIEIWGPEVFGEDPETMEEKEGGFKREMELLDLEHKTRLGELDEEIEDISVQIAAQMKASEKVCLWDFFARLNMLTAFRNWTLLPRKSKLVFYNLF